MFYRPGRASGFASTLPGWTPTSIPRTRLTCRYMHSRTHFVRSGRKQNTRARRQARGRGRLVCVRLFALLTLSLPPLYCSAQTYNNAHITKHVPQTATHAQANTLSCADIHPEAHHRLRGLASKDCQSQAPDQLEGARSHYTKRNHSTNLNQYTPDQFEGTYSLNHYTKLNHQIN